MLTIQQLKEMKPESVFASGEIENSPDGLFMTSSNIGKKLLWIAKRGGIHDWAIYADWADKGINHVIGNGNKVTSKPNIKKLVPCDDEAFKMYRY
jgi:hypothetical protein